MEKKEKATNFRSSIDLFSFCKRFTRLVASIGIFEKDFVWKALCSRIFFFCNEEKKTLLTLWMFLRHGSGSGPFFVAVASFFTFLHTLLLSLHTHTHTCTHTHTHARTCTLAKHTHTHTHNGKTESTHMHDKSDANWLTRKPLHNLIYCFVGLNLMSKFLQGNSLRGNKLLLRLVVVYTLSQKVF